MTNPLIDVQGLSVSYGRTTALANVTCAIAPGETVAVIGPNGSGKSTFLRALGRLVTPASGSVRVSGTPVSAWTPRDLGRVVAYVPQETAVLFDFSVREIVAMGRAPYLPSWGFESKNDRAAIERALANMDLEALAERSILEVSGGERQRAFIARALAQQPSILLLDEPTANLDLQYQASLHTLLDRLNRSQRLTIVTVSHDLNAAAFCDRVIVLHNGRLRVSGAPAEVLTERIIGEIYGCRVVVDRHPGGPEPRVTLQWDRA